jgi:hypothetical protein
MRFRVSAVVLSLVLCVSGFSSAQDTASLRTHSLANVRSCPHLNCEILFTYSSNTPLNVIGSETGDILLSNDQWLLVEDAYSDQKGYVHSSLTESFTPESWQTLPVIPTVSDTARDIYKKGLKMGNNPNAFSKVGDCQNVASFFLSDFDDPEEYTLGVYSDLQRTIDQFSGSFSRQGAAVDNGYNVASVLSPLWSNPDLCESNETPLECEYRLNKPSIVIISMETWWAKEPADLYAGYLRQIVEFWINHGVVPILGTKADNLEGDFGLNISIAQVAEEYDIPLWNFWSAVQPLPGHGLTEDGFHLTFARTFLDDPNRIRHGWPVRNLTALQAIDAVWRGVSDEGE